MKTFNKTLGVVAAVLLVAGFLLSLVGLLLGASWRDANVGLITGNDGDQGHHGWGWGWNEAVGTPVTAMAELRERYTGVTALAFELEGAEVTVTEGDEFSLIASGYGTKFESKVEQGVWQLTTKGMSRNQDRHYTVNLTLPRDFVADSMTIDMGMGSFKADALRCKRSQMTVGMGELTVDTLDSPDTVLDCGMGELTIDRLRSKKADLTCGMGQMAVGGALRGKTTVDCSMGSVTLKLEGRAADYGYSTDIGMGSVRIGHDTVEGVGGSRVFDMDRPNTLAVTCGMGEVEVSFAN